MTDFSTYQPPGIYIDEEIAPLVSTVGVQPSVIAIVGPSRGYRERTETVVLTGTAAAPLSELGINPTVGFTIVDSLGVIYSTSDYVLVVGSGDDADVSTTQDNTLTIARSASSSIPSGSTIYVRYRFTPTAFFDPVLANDFDAVRDAFGEAFDPSDSTIISPLSLAARIAFENGASQVVVVPTTGSATTTSRTELNAAYAKLNAFYQVNIIVPLPVGLTGTPTATGDTINIGTDLKNAIDGQVREGIFRIGILGYEKTVTVLPTILSAAYASGRIMLAWPNRMTYYNGLTNTVVEIGGYYLAAAYAGRFAGQVVQMPLTKKQVRGFAGIAPTVLSTMTTTQKNAWSSGGVAVTELARDGRLIVRHGTSTDRSNVTTREVSLTRARDALVRLVQDTTENNQLIGTPIEDDTTGRVKGIVAGALETAKQAKVIVDYVNLKVRQRSIDPSVVEVRFEYRPAYPLNYIVISFSINTTTGETFPSTNVPTA